jgi:hypothetical protein
MNTRSVLPPASMVHDGSIAPDHLLAPSLTLAGVEVDSLRNERVDVGHWQQQPVKTTHSHRFRGLPQCRRRNRGPARAALHPASTTQPAHSNGMRFTAEPVGAQRLPGRRAEFVSGDRLRPRWHRRTARQVPAGAVVGMVGSRAPYFAGSLVVRAEASARRMSSSLTTSTDGSLLASSANSCGATVCRRRARSRLHAMTTLRA